MSEKAGGNSGFFFEMFKTILFLHIAAGLLGLAIGPIAMYSQKAKGLHVRSGLIYFYLMTFVCISAVVLSVMHWGTSWWLLPIALFSFSNAFWGYRAVKKRQPGWLKPHISGMLGSYIAMSTALLVTNIHKVPGIDVVPMWIFWILPTIIGTPLIQRTVQKYAR